MSPLISLWKVQSQRTRALSLRWLGQLGLLLPCAALPACVADTAAVDEDSSDLGPGARQDALPSALDGDMHRVDAHRDQGIDDELVHCTPPCAEGFACRIGTLECVEVGAPSGTPPPEFIDGDGLGAGGGMPVEWGGVVGDYCGVRAFSNRNGASGAARFAHYSGIDHFGMRHQCTSFAMRFLCTIHDERLPNCDEPQGQGSNRYGNAQTWWENTAENRILAALERHPNGGPVPPQPGDVLVTRGGDYGHVAVVRAVAPDFSSLSVIEQNHSHSTAENARPIVMSRSAGGTYTVANSVGMSTLGWLRAPGASAGCGYQVPALLTPADDERSAIREVRFRWIPGDAQYDHYLRIRNVSDGDNGPLVYDWNVGLDTEHTVLLDDGRYRWTVYNRDPVCAQGNGDAEGRCAAPAHILRVTGESECALSPTQFCSGADLWARDACGNESRVQQCPHGCVSNACADCEPNAERYCEGQVLRERDGCGGDRQVERCEGDCLGNRCEDCVPSPETYCADDEVREGDGCGDDRLVERCAHGCAGGACTAAPAGPRVDSVEPLQANLDEETTFTVQGVNLPNTLAFFIPDCEDVVNIERGADRQRFRCTPSWSAGRKDGRVADRPGGALLHEFTVTVVAQECDERCFDEGRRNPRANERVAGNPTGQVLDLRVTSTNDCGSLGLRASKADGSNLGAGRYFLRVGTCAEHGAVREERNLGGVVQSIQFTTPFSGRAGETKEFCVTKEDGGNRAWWFSNFAVVSMECR